MKVIIKITKDGFTKTVKYDDGRKIRETWHRNDNSYSPSDDTILFKRSDLLDDTKDALDINHDLFEISQSLETETAEIYPDEDNFTNDGHKLQRGDDFFYPGCTSENGRIKYFTFRGKYPQDWGPHGSNAYFERQKCVDHCKMYDEPM